MKKEEVIVLERNGIDRKRILSLSKSLKGYSELKKEVEKMQRVVIKKEKEIEDLDKKIKGLEKDKFLDGLR